MLESKQNKTYTLAFSCINMMYTVIIYVSWVLKNLSMIDILVIGVNDLWKVNFYADQKVKIHCESKNSL